MQLTEKENMLLKDLISAEQLCVDKYRKSGAEAKDGGLKNLFTDIGNVEQTHLDTLNTISQGSVPNMSSTGAAKPQAPSAPANVSAADRQADQFLCSDLLDTEKHVSAVYNTCIFEFAQPELRSALNHIQKEEQEHGEQIYCYMSTNGMYN